MTDKAEAARRVPDDDRLEAHVRAFFGARSRAERAFYSRFGWRFRRMGDAALITDAAGVLLALHLPDFARMWNEGYDGRTGGAAVFDVDLPDRESVDYMRRSQPRHTPRAGSPTWSPDGQWVVFWDTGAGGECDFSNSIRASLGYAAKGKIVAREWFSDPDWSPHGRHPPLSAFRRAAIVPSASRCSTCGRAAPGISATAGIPAGRPTATALRSSEVRTARMQGHGSTRRRRRIGRVANAITKVLTTRMRQRP